MTFFSYDRILKTQTCTNFKILSITENDNICWQHSDDLTRTACVSGLYADGPEYYCCIPDNASTLIILGESSIFLHLISLISEQQPKSIQLYRVNNDDPSFFRQQFVALNKHILFIYECGIMQLDHVGSVAWHTDMHFIDRFYDRIVDGYAIYKSEHEGELKVRLCDGEIFKENCA